MKNSPQESEQFEELLDRIALLPDEHRSNLEKVFKGKQQLKDLENRLPEYFKVFLSRYLN